MICLLDSQDPAGLTSFARLVLFFALPFVGACSQPPDSFPAEVVFLNGKILPPGPNRPPAEALAIAEGKILRVGCRKEIEELVGVKTRQVDLGGKVLIPGLVDHHIHLLNVGLSLLNRASGEKLFLDLSGKSLEEIGRQVENRAAQLSPGSWILGKGWNQETWSQLQLPTHQILSRAAPNHPVYLSRVDGHAGWANQAALARGGLSSSTADPAGGAIGRLGDASPSGSLLERANELVLAHVPLPSDEQVAEAFRLACRAMASQGITEVYDAGFLQMPGVVGLTLDFERVLQTIRASDLESPLPLQVNLMIPAPTTLAGAILADPDKFRVLTPRLRVSHFKLFADGAMGSRGAGLSHPYADDPSAHGVRRLTREEIHEFSLRAIEAGFDVATHCIGDAAVSMTLDVYQELLAKRPGLAPERLRIEHFSYAAEEDFRRAADLGIILSVQPNFVVPDANGETMEQRRVGHQNSSRVYAWQRLTRLGAKLAGGSDYFTAPGVPLLNYYCAVTRKNSQGQPAEGWHPRECLERNAALRLFTRFYLPGAQPPRDGELEAGRIANLVILSADPLVAPENEILEIQVHGTVVGGQFTFVDESLTELH